MPQLVAVDQFAVVASPDQKLGLRLIRRLPGGKQLIDVAFAVADRDQLGVGEPRLRGAGEPMALKPAEAFLVFDRPLVVVRPVRLRLVGPEPRVKDP